MFCFTFLCLGNGGVKEESVKGGESTKCLSDELIIKLAALGCEVSVEGKQFCVEFIWDEKLI